MKNTRMQKYFGEVFDAWADKVVHTTRAKYTWEEAHHAAEKLAKRHGVYGYGYISIMVRPDA